MNIKETVRIPELLFYYPTERDVAFSIAFVFSIWLALTLTLFGFGTMRPYEAIHEVGGLVVWIVMGIFINIVSYYFLKQSGGKTYAGRRFSMKTSAAYLLLFGCSFFFSNSGLTAAPIYALLFMMLFFSRGKI